MRLWIAVGLALTLGACASTYTTPSAGVSLASISEREPDIAAAFERKAAATFPSRIAVARVAAEGYVSKTAAGTGSGAYSVLTTRDIESEESFATLGRMSRVAGIAPLSRLLLPPKLSSTRDLRVAAADLKADVVLVYSIDTRFRTDTLPLGPLQTVTLGFLTSRKASVTATCAFALIDVRTGYVYGVGETTATEAQWSNVWGGAEAVDHARLKAEQAAYEKAVPEVGKVWSTVLSQYDRPVSAAS